MTNRITRTPIMHRIVEHGSTIYLGGITCTDKSLDIGGQTAEVLDKMEAYLAEVGSDATKVLSATIFLTDMSLKSGMDEIWKERFAPEHLPARATVAVAGLGAGNLIEIVVIAHKTTTPN